MKNQFCNGCVFLYPQEEEHHNEKIIWTHPKCTCFDKQVLHLNRHPKIIAMYDNCFVKNSLFNRVRYRLFPRKVVHKEILL